MASLARSSLLARTLAASCIATSGIAALCSSDAAAQVSDFPSKAITLVVPLAPGGSNDILARLVGQKLERKFGKPVIIENRPGAGGITAALGVVRGASDGHTLITASSTMMSLNITIRKQMPYDARKDLTPVAMTVRTPFVLVVNPALPVHSVDDLVKLARERKKPLSFGAPGPATFHRLSAEILRNMFELEFTYVPYKGTVPALNDVMGGHIDFMFSDIPPALALVKAGKLRALGVTTGERVAALNEAPPLKDVGMPGFDASSWHTIAIHSGVPREIIEKLAAAIREGMADPAVVETLARDGTIPVVSPPLDELRRFVDNETLRWGKVIEQAGLAGSE
jgi:tripartite-type tricarboxylate transporter receptor subunit TctC